MPSEDVRSDALCPEGCCSTRTVASRNAADARRGTVLRMHVPTINRQAALCDGRRV